MAFNPAAFASAVAQLEANPPPNAIAFANGWADAFYNGFGNPTPPSVAGMLARQAPQLLSLVALQWFSTGTAVNTTSGVTLPWL